MKVLLSLALFFGIQAGAQPVVIPPFAQPAPTSPIFYSVPLLPSGSGPDYIAQLDYGTFINRMILRFRLEEIERRIPKD